MVRKKSAKKVQDAAEKVEAPETKTEVAMGISNLPDAQIAKIKKEWKNRPVDSTVVTVEEVESVTPATEPDVTPKLQSDAEALRELQQLLDERPAVPAAITSIKDGADFVTEYERWNRKADRLAPK